MPDGGVGNLREAAFGVSAGSAVAGVPAVPGIDICGQTLDIMAAAMAEVVHIEAAIKGKVNPSIHAADQAYELALKEGIPFREAYRHVAGALKSK